MKPLEAELLAAMLGQVDALFEPVNYAWEGTGNQYQTQWQYRRLYDWTNPGLLPWTNPGEDNAEKKRYSRAMNALAGQGLIRTSGKAAGLTPEGLIAARKLCGRLQLNDCLSGIDFMLSLIGTKHEWIGGEGSPEAGFISEASLAGYSPRPPGTIGKTRLPDSALWTVDPLIPLAIAGLVEHDFRPQFELPLYRLTDEGWKLAKERRRAGKADPKAWPKLKKQIKHVEPDSYFTGWQAMKSFLESAPPLQKNRVKHPLGDIWPREFFNTTGGQPPKQKNERENTNEQRQK